jgi:hypothetical protein
MLVALVVVLSPVTTPASAQTTIGQPASPDTACEGGGVYAQASVVDGASYRVASAGTLTAFSTRAFDVGAADTTMRLVVLRPAANPGGRVVSISAETITLPMVRPLDPISVAITPVAVQAGDSIGMSLSEGSGGIRCLLRTNGRVDEYIRTPFAPVAGEPLGLLIATPTGFRVSIAATFEPPPDVTPPETSIDAGPSGLTASTDAQFAFSSSEQGSTFACNLDEAGYLPCTSPLTYSGLTQGPHSLLVVATDASNNADPSPASRAWTVDTVAPDTTITSGPSGVTSSATLTYTFTASEAPASFQCRVDSAPFAACSSPHTTTPLANGVHTFSVRAIDAAGNTDATPAQRSTTVCTGPTSAVAISLYQLLFGISPALAAAQLAALCG